MKALLDIGRTKLTIDLSPINLDPRIEVVRQFCSLLNDDRAGRSHYSTLLYARIEVDERPRRVSEITINEVKTASYVNFPGIAARGAHPATRVRNLSFQAHARSPEAAAEFCPVIPVFTSATGIFTRGSPGSEPPAVAGGWTSECQWLTRSEQHELFN